jgi:hypothetical protein
MYNSYFRDNITAQSIVSFVQGDVNGDGMSDNVYLTGIKTSDSPFTQNITLVIQDGRTGRFTNVPLSDNSGYNPRLFLGEFTGDGIDDILISIDSGGSGAIMYHYIYSFINNMPQLLFDFNSYNEEYNYEVTYKDNYRVEVISEKNNKNYILDISTRDDEYLHEIYYENGMLKSPISGFVNPLSGLYPVDFDSNNVYELLAYQKIAGRYNADSLGYVLNTLKWKDNMFILDNQYVAIF